MLSSFTAQNFRLFTNLDIPRLSRVNLFVGRNNSGKSSLLEAIEVYFSNASLSTLISIVSAREEAWRNLDSSPELASKADDIFRSLFKDYRLPALGEEGLTLGPIHSKNEQLRVTTVAYQAIEREGVIQRQPLSPAQYAALLETGSPVKLDLVAIEAGKQKSLSIRTTNDSHLPLQVVPARRLPLNKAAALWDITALTDLAGDVIAGLRVVEPKVQDIAFVEARAIVARIPLVRLAGHPGPLPLSSMGDGITRLFHIILALVNAKQGVLLVDEFENGLHWSVQEKIWETVFQLAEQLDVQVFATTHSRDCIQAFQTAWERHESLGTYYRLEADGQGEIKARSYSLDTLADSVATDVETR